MSTTPACQVCGVPVPDPGHSCCPDCRAFPTEDGGLTAACSIPRTLAFDEDGRATGPDPWSTSEGLISSGPRMRTRTAPAFRLERFGKYERLVFLARGGMGVVYRAVETWLNRPVAIKMIASGLLATPEDRIRFRDEAETAAALSHPNIVPIYEIGEVDGRLYYAMKLIEGTNLAARIGDFRGDPRAAVELIRAIALAVAEAHRCGVLHRDLKPANILIDEQGRPHVTDFGLARRAGISRDLTVSGAPVGTPGYAAPELAGGRRGLATMASDVFGLGAILYELLTGRRAFDGGSMAETLQLVREAPPTPPRRHDPTFDRDLETICLKCLEKDPARRYPTAEALAEELARWLDGQPILARPAGPAERVGRWARRRPEIAALGAALVVVAMLGIGGVIWQWSQAVAERDRAVEAQGRLDRTLARQAREAYANEMVLAQAEWRDGNVIRARELIARHAPRIGETDRGDFEWRYLRRVFGSSFRSRDLGLGPIRRLAVSPDGRTAATAHDSGDVALSDLETGEIRLRLTGHDGAARDVAFSPDGRLVASVGLDGACNVHHAGTGERVARFVDSERPAQAVGFSPDGRRVAFSSIDRVRIWEFGAPGPKRDVEIRVGGMSSLAFAPGGDQLLLAGLDGVARVYDARTGERRLALDGHGDTILSVAYRPDGAEIATASRDGTLRIWDAADGRLRLSIPRHGSQLASVSYSPRGHRLVTAGYDHLVRTWSASDGHPIGTYRGHTREAASAVYRQVGAGEVVVSGGGDGHLIVWDADTPQEYRLLASHSRAVWGLATGPDGLAATGGFDRQVRLWDLDSGTVRCLLEGSSQGVHRLSLGLTTVEDLALSPDGSLVAVGTRGGRVWVHDAATGSIRAVISAHRGRAAQRGAVTGTPRSERIWSVSGVAFSPDGRRLITVGSGDVMARVWDVATWSLALEFRAHDPGVSAALFSPDGTTLATCGQDGCVRLWGAADGVLLRTLAVDCGHDEDVDVQDVDFSPDGARIVAAVQDGTARVWDAATGRRLAVLRGHDGRVLDAVFSPDGRRIATSGDDRTVRLWDPETGLPVLVLRDHPQPVDALAFTSDGESLATIGGDGTLRIRDAGPVAGPTPR